MSGERERHEARLREINEGEVWRAVLIAVLLGVALLAMVGGKLQ